MQIDIVEAPALKSHDDVWLVDRVKAALAAGETVEIRGSSGTCWCAYIVGGDGEYDLPVSPVYSRDVGDTLRDCVNACERAYGVRLPHNRGAEHNDRPTRTIGTVDLPWDASEAYGFNWHDDNH